MLENARTHSLRTLVVILIFMFMLLILLDAGLYFGIKHLLINMSPQLDIIKVAIPLLNTDISIQNISDFGKYLNLLIDSFFVFIVPISATFILISAIILWLLIKISVSSIFSKEKTLSDLSHQKPNKTSSESSERKKSDEKRDYVEIRIEQERQRRLFLHVLSVLQREGRILDFFSEDLSLYDDEQIGAAARSIQEDCKKTVEKYLALAPVINKEEGELVDIEIGFDSNAIKLTGNVSGNPPFRGILRHKGWKAEKKEIPKLSDVVDSSIIAPAEVEIE